MYRPERNHALVPEPGRRRKPTATDFSELIKGRNFRDMKIRRIDRLATDRIRCEKGESHRKRMSFRICPIFRLSQICS